MWDACSERLRDRVGGGGAGSSDVLLSVLSVCTCSARVALIRGVPGHQRRRVVFALRRLSVLGAWRVRWLRRRGRTNGE